MEQVIQAIPPEAKCSEARGTEGKRPPASASARKRRSVEEGICLKSSIQREAELSSKVCWVCCLYHPPQRWDRDSSGVCNNSFAHFEAECLTYKPFLIPLAGGVGISPLFHRGE